MRGIIRLLRSCPSKRLNSLERTMAAAEQPADAHADQYRRVWLRLDGLAQQPFERARGLRKSFRSRVGDLRCAVARLPVHIFGCALDFPDDAFCLLLHVAHGAVEAAATRPVLGHLRISD